jgi:hypothetical protein
MGALFGTPKPDTSALEAREEAARKKELTLANEIAARRRAGSAASKTIFAAVEGNATKTIKKTKLGE